VGGEHEIKVRDEMVMVVDKMVDWGFGRWLNGR